MARSDLVGSVSSALAISLRFTLRLQMTAVDIEGEDNLVGIAIVVVKSAYMY